MIQIKKVESKSDFKTFVKFPFKLYKGNPFWVSPIINEELNLIDVIEELIISQFFFEKIISIFYFN